METYSTLPVIYYHCAYCGGALMPEVQACDSCGERWETPVPPEEEVPVTRAAFWPSVTTVEETSGVPEVTRAWNRLPLPVRVAAPGGLALFLLAMLLISRHPAPFSPAHPLVSLVPSVRTDQSSTPGQQLQILEDQEGTLSSQETKMEYNGLAGTDQWRVNKNEQVALKGQITALREQTDASP